MFGNETRVSFDFRPFMTSHEGIGTSQHGMCAGEDVTYVCLCLSVPDLLAASWKTSKHLDLANFLANLVALGTTLSKFG